jgi:inner membrane protease subunit 1
MPTLSAQGDVVLVEKLSLRGYIRHPNTLKHGDIVVLRSPQEPLKTICKRVVGRPGELVWSGVIAERVPPGHVWLEGDNKSKSNDSRAFGPVPVGLISGRVVMKVWPWWEFGKIL